MLSVVEGLSRDAKEWGSDLKAAKGELEMRALVRMAEREEDTKELKFTKADAEAAGRAE